MPSSKLLKERIESIQDTMKITNAMYLISSSKLRKARKNYQNAGDAGLHRPQVQVQPFPDLLIAQVYIIR